MQSTNAKFQKGIALEKIRSDQTFSVTTRFNCTSKLAQKILFVQDHIYTIKIAKFLLFRLVPTGFILWEHADRIYFQIKVRTTSKVILNIKRI